MKTWKWMVVAAVPATLAAMSSLAAPKQSGTGAQVKRGAYLVKIGGCNDCHTPWKMGPKGPENDMTRMLSGHPEQLAITKGGPPAGDPWMATVSGTFTAWSGPWGTSFSANLTPDAETGLGKWTYANFAEAMRSGRHMGKGRPILPPMPWQNVSAMTDDDLKAVFAYLQSIPPIRNRVPQPLAPEGAPAGASSSDAPPPTK